jgi:branched-subunit amino acid aminotransferase/4-amino-4-deoxychorismate lyase
MLPGFVKHRSRGAWMVEVRRRGVDEILFVDADGRFTEGTSCAVVTVVGGKVWTAPWDGRILASTTLRRLLAHATHLGIEVVRKGARPSEPFDALYVASTTRSLAPVEELDGRPLPTWDPIGRRLAAADDASRTTG